MPNNPILYNDDIIEFDPRVIATGGQKGAILKYGPDIGTPVVLQKQDNGITTNWTPIAGGGGGIPATGGNPNSVIFYNSSGAAATTESFKYYLTGLFLQSTDIINAGTLSLVGDNRGSEIFGLLDGSNVIITNAKASSVRMVNTTAGDTLNVDGDNQTVSALLNGANFVTGFSNTVYGYGRINISGNRNFCNVTGSGGSPAIVSGVGSIVSAVLCNVSSNFSATFGFTLENHSYASLLVGENYVMAGNPTASVGTDPLFIAASGTDTFRVDKDGRVQTRASVRDRSVKSLSGNVLIVARTDRTIILNDATAGAFTIELPNPEDGLELRFGVTAGSTSAWTFDAATNGGSLDGNANVTLQFDPSVGFPSATFVTLIALAGVWYRVV